jgi:hypothetical protein
VQQRNRKLKIRQGGHAREKEKERKFKIIDFYHGGLHRSLLSCWKFMSPSFSHLSAKWQLFLSRLSFRHESPRLSKSNANNFLRGHDAINSLFSYDGKERTCLEKLTSSIKINIGEGFF